LGLSGKIFHTHLGLPRRESGVKLEHMDPQLWIQAGIGVVTLYILREYLTRTDKRIDDRDSKFIKFATDHNDAMADLIRESSTAIRHTGDAIKEHTNLLKKLK
jgi:hypothetical protein